MPEQTVFVHGDLESGPLFTLADQQVAVTMSPAPKPQESAVTMNNRQHQPLPSPSNPSNGSTSLDAAAVQTQPDASKRIDVEISSPGQIHPGRLHSRAWWYTVPASADNPRSRPLRIVSIPGRLVETMAPATQAPIVNPEPEPQASWKDWMGSLWSPLRGYWGAETG